MFYLYEYVIQEDTLDKANAIFYHGNKHIVFMVKSNFKKFYFTRANYICTYVHNQKSFHGR